MINSSEAYQQFHAFAQKKISSKRTGKNEKNLLNKMDQWAAGEMHCAGDLSGFVYTERNGKVSARKIIEEFYDFVGEDEETKNQVVPNDPISRIFEEMKFMHKKRTKNEIAEHFGIHPKTVQRDLEKMERGFEFLGIPINLQKTNEGEDVFTYKMLKQPVLLMPTAQLCAVLTSAIYNLAEMDSLHGESLKKIACLVYDQLTDTMKQQVADFQDLMFYQKEDEEAELKDVWKEQLIEMLHARKKGTIEYSDKGEVTELYNCSVTRYDFKKNEILVLTEDRVLVWIPLEHIENCEVNKEKV